MKSRSETLYIPPRIAKTVNIITHKPLTLITAGSGFGKTTAVVECLKRVPQETLYHWYTCFGEPPERAWEGMCRLIAFADAQVGDYLSKLELPSLDHLGQIASLVGETSCEKDTILVIDNFQLAAFPAPYRLLSALAAHGCDRLHIVVLSHPFYTDAGAVLSDPRIAYIPQEVFCFQPADVTNLFSRCGAELTQEQSATLCAATEGWVAALRLHLSGFLADGTLSVGVGMGELMERVFWRQLDERQRSLFSGLSLLDTFTEAQAARMLGRDVIPDELWASVRNNAFVRRAGSEYMLHALLKSFLGAKLQTQSAALRKKLYAGAGAAYQTQGKNLEAVLFFVDAHEDTSALSVPLSSLQLAELIRAYPQRLELLLSRCHSEVLAGRWQLLLDTAVKASLNGKRSLAKTALLRLEQMSETGDETRGSYANAALAMAASFQAYNDLGEMCRYHARAISLLDDPLDFYVTNDSWTFCVPSVVYMFWRESGKLSENAALLRSGIPNYTVLGGGKGSGSPEIMEAERLLLAGRLEESVDTSYFSRTIAQKAGQDSLTFCAWTQLARTAILRGDAAAFEANAREIERLAFTGKEFLCVTASEMALGFLYSLLDLEKKLPAWLLSAETVRNALYPISAPFAYIVTLRHIRKHSPAELIGTAEAFIQETDALHHLMPKLYYLLEEAVWYEQNGERERALDKTALALSLALPDQVFLPFAEYYGELGAAVLDDSRLACGHGEALTCIRSLGRRFVSGASMIRAAISAASPLTPREREIALLAQQRVSTKEIAETLHISPATVKNTLNRVYSKLGIAGKSELSGRQL